MKRDAIDFHAVPQRQEPIHGELLNWALYINPAKSPRVSAMFRGYRPERTAVYNPPSPRPVCDFRRAMAMNGKVTKLDSEYRLAIQWFYVQEDRPHKACDRIEAETGQKTPPERLAELVILARDMLGFVAA